MENVSVPPDIEVEELPADYIAGRDAQLEKALEVILEEPEKNPPQKPNVRPIQRGEWLSDKKETEHLNL